jgi:hypothetical protein
MLSDFKIPTRELNEILYDYIDPSGKPQFITTIEKDCVRVWCSKCMKITKNTNFTESGTDRQYHKHSKGITLPINDVIKQAVKDVTYFETCFGKNTAVMKGYYDFRQLTDREQFIVTNIVFEQNKELIPQDFELCVVGLCA